MSGRHAASTLSNARAVNGHDVSARDIENLAIVHEKTANMTVLEQAVQIGAAAEAETVAAGG